MGHFTYEEQFVFVKDALKLIYMEKCHPNFCQICFNKMYQVEVGGGATELKTDLVIFNDGNQEAPDPSGTESRVYEPDGYGSANKVAVRPHIVQGTACGWGNTNASVGANLWHATISTSNVSICQQDNTIDKAVETMFIRNDDMTLTPNRDGSRRLDDDQLRAACRNPRLMSAKCFDPKPNVFEQALMPTIDESMPED